MIKGLTFGEIEHLTGFTLGIFDSACPACGPGRRSPQNRARRVLRIWRKEPDFATFKCARCDLEGSVRPDARCLPSIPRQRSPTLSPTDPSAAQAAKAAALWRSRRPIGSSLAETYLRQVRGCGAPLPATLGFLEPIKPEHHPAMIAAFGLAEEREPDTLAIAERAVRGVHLTLLRCDGGGKANVQPNKLMVGPSSGAPIVVAPINDGLGLIICEGIETGLSLGEATGCGVWAAGAAGRLPALAAVVPAWIDTVTIAAEPDPAGRKGAAGLAERLRAAGIWCEVRILGAEARAA